LKTGSTVWNVRTGSGFCDVVGLPLNSRKRAPIVGNMKRIASFVVCLSLAGARVLCAQDAASEERYNKLSGQIEDLRSAQESLNRKIDALGKDIESVRAHMDKQPSGSFASEEDVKRLADSVKEVDRKRLDDYEKIRTELKSLGKTLAASTPSIHKNSASSTDENPSRTRNTGATEQVYEYEVKKGDTLSVIVQAYRDNNIKITRDQILKANPGLKPEKMRVGQKIRIPPPQA
jgi:LysM repeat protein/outer membrane murein-binding lipoprotein Lpp